MRCLELTLPDAAANLALDEALLEEAENTPHPLETLRFWEPQSPSVVVGRSSKIDLEVRREACRQLGVPVLRRVSGGATIVAGPGCLMYALVLDFRLRPDLRSPTAAHRWVLDKMAQALGTLTPDVQCQGTSDLSLGKRKFSGNSARSRREHLLYHGTLLYDFPLERIERLLTMPPRMPDYRDRRPHESFLVNLPLQADAIRTALMAAFDAHEPCDDWPKENVASLVAEKYSRPQWNEQGHA